MIPALWLVVLLQGPPCSAEAFAALERADARLRAFDTSEAIARFESAGQRGCLDGVVGAAYLRGLSAARAAYAVGGSPASLVPVNDAIRELETLAKTGHQLAEVARVMLLAASAAAQSERDDMTTFIEHAGALERKTGRARSWWPSVPEVAGDLWLQVHRFDDAREAYLAAIAVDRTPAASLGLARVAARQNDIAMACIAYRAVLRGATAEPSSPPIAEATRFIGANGCPPK